MSCPDCDSNNTELLGMSSDTDKYEYVEGKECKECGNEYTVTGPERNIINRLLRFLK
jgi:transcriptional regulator NrdR family protein